MLIGYARVSTRIQNTDLQVDALKKAGCEKIYVEKRSTRAERPKFDQMIGLLRPGDTVVVWKLDRLGRTMLELIKLINHFNDNEIGFKCINDNFIDTTSPHGKLVFSIFSALAEYEKELNRERSLAGLKAARERGRIGGRPSGLSHDAKLKAMAAASLYHKGESISSILKILNIGSKATLYKYLRHEGLKIGK